MGTGFLLLYKRFEAGRLSWPRNTQEAAELTEEQYKYLMMGLNPLDPKIKDVDPESIDAGVTGYPLFRIITAGIKFNF